ncbi:MAG: outer membrane protein [Methyloceanibacter sp.]
MAYRLLALGVCATLLAAATPVTAGDFPHTPETQWGGFYVGGQLGGVWSETDWQYENHNWFNTLGPALVISNFDIDGSGIAGGGQAGFNYQTGAWVFGIEGSVVGTELDGSIRSPFFPASDVYSMDVSWLTTLTGRVGYAWDRWLAYAKGGWAGADIELDLFDQGTPQVRANSSTWADGYTLGGGAEYAFGNGFSLGAEYAYVDLGTDRFTVRCPTCPPGVGGGVPVVDGDIEIQSVTARVNYRFGQ